MSIKKNDVVRLKVPTRSSDIDYVDTYNLYRDLEFRVIAFDPWRAGDLIVCLHSTDKRVTLNVGAEDIEKV